MAQTLCFAIISFQCVVVQNGGSIGGYRNSYHYHFLNIKITPFIFS